jgi:predicted phosphate transport protein (TIGR00153 family)
VVPRGDRVGAGYRSDRVAGNQGAWYRWRAHPTARRDGGARPTTSKRAGRSIREIAMFSLFPKEEDFFTLFRKQAELVRKGCDQLHEMMERFDDLPARAKRLKDVEHDADLVTHDLFERLNRTFITPLEREDIHDLGSGLDDVLDAAEAIGSRLVLFNIPRSTPAAVQLTGILAQCSHQIEQAVSQLKDLKQLSTFTIEINRLENEADHISRQVVADLFTGKHDLLDVMRWRELYGRLEGAADKCEDVANTIDAIVLKNR